MAVEHVWFWYDNFLKELFLSYQRTLTILLTILLSHGLTNLRVSLVILLHLSKVWKLWQSNKKLQQQRIQIILILLGTFEKLKFFFDIFKPVLPVLFWFFFTWKMFYELYFGQLWIFRQNTWAEGCLHVLTMSFFSLARPVREHMTLLVHSWLEA